MILDLRRPIKDSNDNYIKRLEYDLYDLTIKDFNNVEKLYFNIMQDNSEYLVPESQLIYKLCTFFISCCKANKNLSFTEFLRVKGKDRRKIVKIVDNFFIPSELTIKKKD